MRIDNVTGLTTPALYYRERAYLSELVEPTGARHWFGGALDLAITGEPHGPYPLHRIMTIDLTDDRLGVGDPQNFGQLPLVFGMRYEASELRYEVESSASIKLKWPCEAGPSSPDDWPYDEYPDALPRLGLRFLDPSPCKLEAVSDLTHQGINFAEPDEMIVIVPSTKDYAGTSLWGKSGCGVQILFHLTTADRIVFATHQVD
jgi:hypothetical protein